MLWWWSGGSEHQEKVAEDAMEQPVAVLGPKGWDICGIDESQCDNTFYFPCKNQIFVRRKFWYSYGPLLLLRAQFFPLLCSFHIFKPTHCTAAPTQLFQSGGRPRRSVPAELKWDLESWGAALPDWEASPASSSRAGDTVGSTFCTGHLPCRYIGIAFHSFISKHKISKLNWMQFKIFIRCLNI